MDNPHAKQPMLVSWQDQFTVIAKHHVIIPRTGEPVVRLTLNCRGRQTLAYLRYAESQTFGNPDLGQRIHAHLWMQSFPRPGRLIVLRHTTAS